MSVLRNYVDLNTNLIAYYAYFSAVAQYDIEVYRDHLINYSNYITFLFSKKNDDLLESIQMQTVI